MNHNAIMLNICIAANSLMVRLHSEFDTVRDSPTRYALPTNFYRVADADLII